MEVKLSLYTLWRRVGGVKVLLQLFLISALGVGEWLTSRLTTLSPGENHGFYWMWSSVDPRIGMYVLQNLNKKNLFCTDNRTPDQTCSTPNIIRMARVGEKFIRGYGREAWRKETTWRSGRRWEANFKMGLKDVRRESWVHLAQDNCKWRVPESVGSFFTVWGPVSFSRRAVRL